MKLYFYIKQNNIYKYIMKIFTLNFCNSQFQLDFVTSHFKRERKRRHQNNYPCKGRLLGRCSPTVSFP